ncbi:hypothetical protein BGZ73_009067 [Actinomortierella ambigua]|nr:hypothetical protein BGZ73_009067 [Actinomortierella ambigua]
MHTNTRTTTTEEAAGDGQFQEMVPAQGILRLFRDAHEITTGKIERVTSTTTSTMTTTSTKAPIGSEDTTGTSVIYPDENTSVCVLAVPSYMSPGDFLNFVGPVRQDASHFRIIRFMVLIKFRSPESTAAFYKRYNGRPFSSLEPEICHVVYLKSIEIRAGGVPPYAFPFLHEDPFLKGGPSPTQQHLLKSPINSSSSNSLQGSAPSPSILSAPTTGQQETGSAEGEKREADDQDPTAQAQKSVRRHLNRHRRSAEGFLDGLGGQDHLGGGEGEEGEEDEESQSQCVICGTTENLWICLICGHIGCGRYQEKHAYHHYYNSHHLYALELETQRVWDYAGDGYVHRLIQNKTDGKLVELPGAVDEGPHPLSSEHSVQIGQEKLDAIGLEYTHLLTTQLESQRMYFDAQMAAMTQQLNAKLAECMERERALEQLRAENATLKSAQEELERVRIPSLVKDKKLAEKKLEKLQERLATLERQYEEEKEMNAGLQVNSQAFKDKIAANDAVIEDLREQVRDMMIYLSTQQKVEASPLKDELVNGTIGVVPAPSSSSPRNSNARRKRK